MTVDSNIFLIVIEQAIELFLKVFKKLNTKMLIPFFKLQ